MTNNFKIERFLICEFICRSKVALSDRIGQFWSLCFCTNRCIQISWLELDHISHLQEKHSKVIEWMKCKDALANRILWNVLFSTFAETTASKTTKNIINTLKFILVSPNERTRPIDISFKMKAEYCSDLTLVSSIYTPNSTSNPIKIHFAQENYLNKIPSPVEFQ